MLDQAPSNRVIAACWTFLFPSLHASSSPLEPFLASHYQMQKSSQCCKSEQPLRSPVENGTRPEGAAPPLTDSVTGDHWCQKIQMRLLAKWFSPFFPRSVYTYRFCIYTYIHLKTPKPNHMESPLLSAIYAEREERNRPKTAVEQKNQKKQKLSLQPQHFYPIPAQST